MKVVAHQPVQGGRRLFELEGEDLDAFERIKGPITYKPNQIVFYEGHASIGLYMLCSGK
jgi:hypothetical protein